MEEHPDPTFQDEPETEEHPDPTFLVEPDRGVSRSYLPG